MKVLLAVDGSKYSEAATRALVSQMHADGLEVLVLQIVEPIYYSAPPQMARGYEPEMAEKLREQTSQAELAVAHAAESLRAAGFNVKTRVAESEVRSGILDAAAEWQADMIVLGSHGRRGVQRFMLGSVAESVARHASCSVLIVRSKP